MNLPFFYPKSMVDMQSPVVLVVPDLNLFSFYATD